MHPTYHAQNFTPINYTFFSSMYLKTIHMIFTIKIAKQNILKLQ